MNLNFFLELFFPSSCLGCSKRTVNGEIVCASCLSAIHPHTSLFCGRCQARLPEGKKICHLDHPYILGAALDYQDKTVNALVKTLKFKRDKRAALLLGKLLAQYARRVQLELGAGNFFVLPVPLSERRQRERGFNQAELVAAEFAKNLNLPLLRGGFLKIRHTPAQSKLKTRAERESNLTGAFLATPEFVAGKNIILLDDVTTSGVTFKEAALALKAAGGKKIIALAAAKA